MEDVLHAMDHRRTLRAFGNVDDAFQSQQADAAMLGEGFEK